jgi:AraC family transcriptional regulator
MKSAIAKLHGGLPVSEGSPRYTTIEAHGFQVTEAWFPPSLGLPPHYHDPTCVAVILEGSFDLQFRRITFACPPSTLVTLPAGERHASRVERAGARALIVALDSRHEGLLRPCVPMLGEITHFRHGHLARLASQLARELASPDAVAPIAIEGLVMELLAMGARLQNRRPGRPPAWLERAVDLLRSRFLERLRTGDVAREVGVHPIHLARVFRAHYGVSLGGYLRRLRLDWAAARLRESESPLDDIALEAGFADQSHFTRMFRQYSGCTPGKFRRRACGGGDAS